MFSGKDPGNFGGVESLCAASQVKAVRANSCFWLMSCKRFVASWFVCSGARLNRWMLKRMIDLVIGKSNLWKMILTLQQGRDLLWFVAMLIAKDGLKSFSSLGLWLLGSCCEIFWSRPLKALSLERLLKEFGFPLVLQGCRVKLVQGLRPTIVSLFDQSKSLSWSFVVSIE